MSLIELNGLNNNSASVIMKKKGLFGVLIGTHETLEYREKENIMFFFPLPSRARAPITPLLKARRSNSSLRCFHSHSLSSL